MSVTVNPHFVAEQVNSKANFLISFHIAKISLTGIGKYFFYTRGVTSLPTMAGVEFIYENSIGRS